MGINDFFSRLQIKSATFFLLILSTLSVLFLLGGCIDLVRDSFPPIKEVPVLNSIVVMDSTIDVYVSKMIGLDTSTIPNINNAQISLFKDDVFLEIIPLSDSGQYNSNSIAQANSKYSCVVNIPGFSELYCEDSIPSQLSVNITGHTNKAGFNEEGAYYPSISFTFKDNPATTDYYEVLLLEKMKYNRYYAISAFNESYDFLLNEGFEPYSTATLLFSDELINPELDYLTLNYSMGSSVSCYGGQCKQSIDEHTIVLEVRKVSHEYYRYMKHFYMYEKGRYGELIEGVVSPFQMYTNVENGKGIFASYSLAIDSIHIEAERIIF